jgi:hypothetical protein
MQKKYLLKGFIFVIIFLITVGCLNSTAYNIKNCKTTESCDISTWYSGDQWVYNIDPLNYVGVNGSFNGKVENLKYEVIGRTSIIHNDEEIYVYQLDITGKISGDVSSDIISGYLQGNIKGVSYIRVSDLAEVKTEINSSGTVKVLIVNFNYEMSSSNLFFPPIELYDFPIKIDESWNISSRTNSTSYFYLQSLIDENDSGDIWSNQTSYCTGKESINVPAGTFDSFKIEQTNSIVWYSPEVGNNIRSEIDQSDENTTFYMVSSLESYSLVTQPIVVTLDINPTRALVDQDVVISGQAVDSKNGNPIKNGNVNIEIPNTGDIWTTSTDNDGFYNYTINAPKIIDDTPTFEEFGSDGIIVSCSLNDLEGYIVKTLTIKGNNPPNAPTINGPNKAKKGVGSTYEFNSSDPDGDDLYYYIEWGDGSNTSWIGPYSTGKSFTLKHIWNEKNSFQIKAKVKDDDGVESNWTIFKVSTFKNRVLYSSILEKVLYKLQDYFPILKLVF